MVPTNNMTSPTTSQPERTDRGVFDIDRFNRTPEARHYARKASARTGDMAGQDANLNQLVADAQHYSTQSEIVPRSEYKKQTPEEMKVLLDRVAQTNRLLQWMREQAMEGRR